MDESSKTKRRFVNVSALFPERQPLSAEQFDFDDPKGFHHSQWVFEARVAVQLPAVLYRKLAGKENAILDFATERDVFCWRRADCRPLLLPRRDLSDWAFYDGRTLSAEDLKTRRFCTK